MFRDKSGLQTWIWDKRYLKSWNRVKESKKNIWIRMRREVKTDPTLEGWAEESNKRLIRAC